MRPCISVATFTINAGRLLRFPPRIGRMTKQAGVRYLPPHVRMVRRIVARRHRIPVPLPVPAQWQLDQQPLRRPMYKRHRMVSRANPEIRCFFRDLDLLPIRAALMPPYLSPAGRVMTVRQPMVKGSFRKHGTGGDRSPHARLRVSVHNRLVARATGGRVARRGRMSYGPGKQQQPGQIRTESAHPASCSADPAPKSRVQTSKAL